MYKPRTHILQDSYATQFSGAAAYYRQEQDQTSDHEAVLETNDRITASTLEILENNLRDAQEDNSVGAALEIDGQFCFIEFDENHRKQRIAFAKELMEIAKEYCTVKSADAESSPPADATQSADLLNMEEREILLLAKDCNATLLTLDGRLRMLAKDGQLTSNLIIASICFR
jgi:hypothetical protein